MYVRRNTGGRVVKNLTKTGNSFALVIDRAILDLVNIDPETPLEISTDDGRRLILSPVTDPKRLRRFQEALERTNRRHAKTLKRLAE
jgi:antitoxin MazE